MKTSSILLLILLTFSDWKAFAQEVTNITIGSTHKIFSEILQEERSYTIGLSTSYDYSTETYSVMVLLDGDYHFISTYGNVEYLSKRFQIPNLIVVALPNTNRMRDLTPTNSKTSFSGTLDEGLSQTGGSDVFFKFIEEELLKTIDENPLVQVLSASETWTKA